MIDVSPDRQRSGLLRRVAAFGATVVVLAGVILGISALSSRPDSDAPKPTQSGLTDAQRSRLALLKGRELLASGDTTEAVALFEQALKLDPGNVEAERALSSVAASAGATGSKPQSTTEPTAQSDGGVRPDDPVFSTAIEDLTLLLPGDAAGFSLGAVTQGERDVTVSGSPVSSDVRATRALWTVHDRGSIKGADEFIDSVSKDLYPKDSSRVVVDGAQAYFGTDGIRFATVVYRRGRYVFEVVLTAPSGAPKSLAREAKAAAAAFPDRL